MGGAPVSGAYTRDTRSRIRRRKNGVDFQRRFLERVSCVLLYIVVILPSFPSFLPSFPQLFIVRVKQCTCSLKLDVTSIVYIVSECR